MEENQRSQIYLWDGNAAGFYDEGEESPQYYLQDELGSPLRIEGEDGRLRESYGPLGIPGISKILWRGRTLRRRGSIGWM